MPRLRINVRTLTEDDELDLIDDVTELTEREARDTQGKNREEKRPISAINLQRRQESRKFGKDIARMLRERDNPKIPRR
jgi:hypothetical protein